MRQRRWLKLTKDSELEVHYHPGKENVIPDVLSHKAHRNYLPAIRLTGEECSTHVLPNISLFNITLMPTLRAEIIAAQKDDEGMGHIKRRMWEGDPKVACFHEDVEGTSWFKKRLLVPKKEALKKILDAAHTSRYSIHPGSTKMYHDLRQQFWWIRMKREAARYVSECDTCQKVKVNYMKPGGLFQPLSIPEWKWDDISMDFTMGLPMMAGKFDSIWVIVDRLFKSAHFIPINTNYKVQKYVEIYIAHMLCLHGVPKAIISDQGLYFVARFWEQLHSSLGTHLIHSSAYHSQTDGQTERVNQILKDMLRACVLEYQGSWDHNLPLAEFSYNNSYQENLKMAPFEVLYGCWCSTPLNWIELGEKVIFGPDLVEEAEATVRRIRDNLKATKSRQETYANKRCRPLEFKDINHVYLIVSPMKGVKRFGVKGKWAPRYIGLFPILEKYGTVAYKLDLPPSLARVHDIFHVSQLKKCLKAPVDVVLPEVAPLEDDLSYPEHPIKVLDQKDSFTSSKTIKYFKIQWSNHSKEDATWESEDFLRSRLPDIVLP
jgi:hypothetical protein